MMKAAVNTRYGSPDVVELRDVPKPQPGPDEVLVRVHATTVSRTDCGALRAHPFFARLFTGLRRPKRTILGMDFAGEVEVVGAEVTSLKTSDRVFGLTPGGYGGHAEYLSMPESGAIAAIPAGVRYDEAVICEGALYADTYLRALGLLKDDASPPERDGRAREKDAGSVRSSATDATEDVLSRSPVRFWRPRRRSAAARSGPGPGRRILIYGASGAIGTAAVQLAKADGAEVTAVVATRHLELVRSLGADRAIDYTIQDFTEIDETFDFVFDAVGKASYFRCRRLLRPGGRFSAADFGPRNQNLLVMLWSAISRSKRFVFPIPRSTKASVESMRARMEAGEFHAVVDRKYPLEAIVDAYRYVETEQKTGIVVIDVGS